MRWPETVATIWPQEGVSAAEAQSIADALNRAPHLIAYARGGRPGIPERLHYSASERVAPVVAIADEGWSITQRGCSLDRSTGSDVLEQNLLFQ